MGVLQVKCLFFGKQKEIFNNMNMKYTEENAKLHSKLNIKAFTLTDDSLVPFIREQVRSGNKPQADGINNSYEISNIVTTVGMQEIMKFLADQDVGSGGVNYGALGDGTPNPLVGSTALDNEVYRKVRASAAYADNKIYVDFFYTKSETSGTYTEFGSFINSTATPDDPFLFSYIATGGWTKSTLESLFVSCEYTLTNA